MQVHRKLTLTSTILHTFTLSRSLDFRNTKQILLTVPRHHPGDPTTHKVQSRGGKNQQYHLSFLKNTGWDLPLQLLLRSAKA